MTLKHLFVLSLALFVSILAQSDDELHIPVENDNQFPPDNHAEPDGNPVEGSGAGIIEEPLEATTDSIDSPPPPLLEEVQLTSTIINNETATNTAEHSCPSPCVCNIEGDSSNFIVDCSNSALTTLPKPIDSKTTQLNLQNNKLTEIPKEISTLKNLKILNLNNNEIMEILSGSISELPELKSLKLGNNRLLEYPTDLKNSFGLTKLEELDLGGNDMRTGLKPESFSNFKALQKLVLPSGAAGLVEDICSSLRGSLETVCTESCDNKTFVCPDAPQTIDDDLLDFALPGLIALGTSPEEIADPSLSASSNTIINEHTLNEASDPIPSTTTENAIQATENSTTSATSAVEVSFRSVVIKASDEESKPTPNEPEPKSTEAQTNSKIETKPEGEVIGATTSNSKTGGVDKSVIGIIVAGMVLVVAGITIKKNWTSIRNRFSSSPRNANDRSGVNANGTSPEEVPLQEKSPPV